jgi:thioredoxin-like negative regulator of GroEL
MMKPWMAELEPKTEFILLDDVDEESLILLNIQSVPVIVKFVDGVEVGRLMGGQSKATMAKFVKD